MNLLLLLGLDFYDFFARVVAAVGANVVRPAQFVTLRAFNEMGGAQRQVASPSIATTFGQFPFW